MKATELIAKLQDAIQINKGDINVYMECGDEGLGIGKVQSADFLTISTEDSFQEIVVMLTAQ